MVNNLLTGLVSYYKCDTNGSYPDAEGSNTGSIQGATYDASGLINGCYDYDGNDYVVIDGTDFQTTGSFSVSLWCNFDAGNSANRRPWSIGGRGDDATLVRRSTNYFRWGVTGLSPSVCDGNITVNDSSGWTHVVGVYDADDGRLDLYIDNVLDQQVSVTGTRTQSGLDVYHGCAGYQDSTFEEYFTGKIDEVGYWNKALTSTDVSNLYNSGSGLAYSSFDGGTPSGWTGTINGVTNPSKVNGIAVANITTVNGQ